MRRVSVASARAARRAAKVHRRTGALARSVKPRRGSKTGAGYKCLFYARANPRLRHIYEASKAAAEAKLRADGGGVGVLRRIVGRLMGVRDPAPTLVLPQVHAPPFCYFLRATGATRLHMGR